MNKFLIVFQVEGEDSFTLGNIGIELETEYVMADDLPKLVEFIQTTRNSEAGIIITNIIKLG